MQELGTEWRFQRSFSELPPGLSKHGTYASVPVLGRFSEFPPGLSNAGTLLGVLVAVSFVSAFMATRLRPTTASAAMNTVHPANCRRDEPGAGS